MAAFCSCDASFRREDLIQPVTDAQVGVTTAFGEFIDAHNLLVEQLGELNARQDCAEREHAGIVERLVSVDSQFGKRLGTLSDELRGEIRGACNAAETRERVAAVERQEVREAQGTLATRLTTVDERLATLDASFHALGTQLQEQGSQLLEQLVEQRRRHDTLQSNQEADRKSFLEESLPALHKELLERIEVVGAGLEEEKQKQGLRISKLEKQAIGMAYDLEKAEHDRQDLMAKIEPWEARIGKAEEMCVESGQEITNEIMQLEAQIDAAKRALCDNMKAVCDDYRQAGQDEAADVLNKVGSEGRRINILENTVATLSGELERRLSGMSAEHNSFADQVARDFDMMHGEIETGRTQFQTLEATVQEMKVEMRTSAQRAEQDRGVFATQLLDFDAKHKQLSEGLERCDPFSNRLELMRNLRNLTEEQMMQNEFAAAVTQCLSCGQNKSLSPWSRNILPRQVSKEIMTTTTPGIVVDSSTMTAKRMDNAGFRPARSRPASATSAAGKFSQSGDTESTMTSSTLSICASPKNRVNRRPQSSRKYRAAPVTDVGDQAL